MELERPAQTTSSSPRSNGSTPRTDACDLVIGGGGSAAFPAAIRRANGGCAVIVNAGPEAEGLPTGGTCVSVGRFAEDDDSRG